MWYIALFIIISFGPQVRVELSVFPGYGTLLSSVHLSLFSYLVDLYIYIYFPLFPIPTPILPPPLLWTLILIYLTCFLGYIMIPKDFICLILIYAKIIEIYISLNNIMLSI